MPEIVKKAAMSVKRMGVIIWCVAAIVLVVFLSLYYSQTEGAEVPEYIIITAMTMITALGGVDVWKARKEEPGV